MSLVKVKHNILLLSFFSLLILFGLCFLGFEAFANVSSGNENQSSKTLSASDVCSYGTGANVNNACTIVNAEELHNLSNIVRDNSNYYAFFPDSGATKNSDLYFSLVGNIDLSGYSKQAGWQPIGTEANPFESTFDGGVTGKPVISGLTINIPKSGNIPTVYSGLFGVVKSGAVIKNINFENVDINVAGGAVYAAAAVGYAKGEVGDNEPVTISGIDLIGKNNKIIANGTSDSEAGGLVGFGNSTVNITNSIVIANTISSYGDNYNSATGLGNSMTTNFSNNVVMVDNLSNNSPSSPAINRIVDLNDGSISNNYSLYSTKVNGSALVTNPAISSNDGGDLTCTTLRTADFWTTVMNGMNSTDSINVINTRCSDSDLLETYFVQNPLTGKNRFSFPDDFSTSTSMGKMVVYGQNFIPALVSTGLVDLTIATARNCTYISSSEIDCAAVYLKPDAESAYSGHSYLAESFTLSSNISEYDSYQGAYFSSSRPVIFTGSQTEDYLPTRIQTMEYGIDYNHMLASFSLRVAKSDNNIFGLKLTGSTVEQFYSGHAGGNNFVKPAITPGVPNIFIFYITSPYGAPVQSLVAPMIIDLRTVTYDLDGATGAAAPETEYYKVGKTIKIDTDQVANSLTKTGYLKLAGWCTIKNCQIDENNPSFLVSGDTITVTDNITLYPRFYSQENWCTTNLGVYQYGDGTSSDSWWVGTDNQLALTACLVNNKAGYSTDNFKMTNDVDLGNYKAGADGASLLDSAVYKNDPNRQTDSGEVSLGGWNPIGNNSESSFKGVFDGQNHVVKNLGIDAVNHNGSDSSYNYGLFGCVDGTVENLLVDGAVNVTISQDDSTATNITGNVGGVVGKASSTATLDNLISSGTVMAQGGGVNFLVSHFSIGGVVGNLAAASSNLLNLANVINNVLPNDKTSVNRISDLVGGSVSNSYSLYSSKVTNNAVTKTLNSNDKTSSKGADVTCTALDTFEFWGTLGSWSGIPSVISDICSNDKKIIVNNISGPDGNSFVNGKNPDNSQVVISGQNFIPALIPDDGIIHSSQGFDNYYFGGCSYVDSQTLKCSSYTTNGSTTGDFGITLTSKNTLFDEISNGGVFTTFNSLTLSVPANLDFDLYITDPTQSSDVTAEWVGLFGYRATDTFKMSYYSNDSWVDLDSEPENIDGVVEPGLINNIPATVDSPLQVKLERCAYADYEHGGDGNTVCGSTIKSITVNQQTFICGYFSSGVSKEISCNQDFSAWTPPYQLSIYSSDNSSFDSDSEPVAPNVTQDANMSSNGFNFVKWCIDGDRNGVCIANGAKLPSQTKSNTWKAVFDDTGAPTLKELPYQYNDSVSTYLIFSNPDEGKITVSWRKASDNISSGYGLTYELSYSTVQDMTNPIVAIKTNDPAVLSADVYGLTTGKAYYWQLKVTDEAGNSVVSDPAIKAGTHRISYNYNGGTIDGDMSQGNQYFTLNTMTNSNCQDGIGGEYGWKGCATNILVPTKPQMIGATFTNWCLDGETCSDVLPEGENVGFANYNIYDTMGSDGNITLTANYSYDPVTYKLNVMYDAGAEGKGDMSADNVVKSCVGTFTAVCPRSFTPVDSKFTRSGYHFTGWKDEEANPEVNYKVNQVYSFSSAEDVDIILTAQWALNRCTNGATNYPDCDDNKPKPPAPPVVTCLSTQHNLNGKCVDNLPTSIAIDKTKLTITNILGDRDNFTLLETVKSIYGDLSLANQKVAWSSSDKSVALVNSSGKVTAKKTGVTTITVKT
ncbi:MAG: InlB B-repeat-containing protein, partial [Candidatus Ancillula sp.]|nr:InlB B-repeat-containing protein [Candidatus Ancillula sp.]